MSADRLDRDSSRHVGGSSRPGRMVTIRDRLSVRERLIISVRRFLHLCECLWPLFLERGIFTHFIRLLFPLSLFAT